MPSSSASVRASVTVGRARHRRDWPGLLVLLGVEQGDGPRMSPTSRPRSVTCASSPTSDERDESVGARHRRAACSSCRSSRSRGDARNGRRPSFASAAPPQIARALYEEVVRELQASGLRVATGEFQAMMQVALVNDGPVTILLDSRKTF